MTAVRSLEEITADVIRSGDRGALDGLRELIAHTGPGLAHRLLTTDELPEGSQPGPARLAVRLYDRLVMRGPLVGTLGQLADPLHATRAELADALDILWTRGQAHVTADGAEVTVRLAEFA